MKRLGGTARVIHPLAAIAVVALVFLQVYLIAEAIFGQPGALNDHKTVGGLVVVVELLVLATALLGWLRDRVQVGLSAALAVVGVLQVSFAQNLGNSPAVHALHGLLALVVVLLAAQIAARKRGVFLRPLAAARG
ncbi:MAG: DUF6220 domain-containing protein [Actinomycetes bacterium]